MPAWRLSDAELSAYREDGLVAPVLRLPAELLGQMRGALERLLAANPELAPEGLVCPHIPNGKPGGAEAAAEWFGFCSNPAILDLVEQVLGPDIILWGSQVFCKPARVGRAVPWHQDGKYWPMRPLATCSVWIALDAATPENGCLRYIPGSHRAGSLYEHRQVRQKNVVLAQEVIGSLFDGSQARDDVLEAGQFSLHDVFLIHGSDANRSHQRRAGFVIRYMPASSVFERDLPGLASGSQQPLVAFDFTRRPIWLLRGRDTSGRNDFAVGHDEVYRLVPRASDEEYG
ncbi:MAG: phytanoyl-CoA dioxygenase family protein [Gammaproteobacteria bacterium]